MRFSVVNDKGGIMESHVTFTAAIQAARKKFPAKVYVAHLSGDHILVYRVGEKRSRAVGAVTALAQIADLTGCEWCGWPKRTGFPDEASQKTEYCEHG